MNTERIVFFLSTIGVHMIGFSLFWQEASFKNGDAKNLGGTETAFRILEVAIVAGKDPSSLTNHNKAQTEKTESAEPLDSTGEISSPLLLQSVASPPQNSQQAALQEAETHTYFPAGQLTKLPTPLSEIDLDVSEFKDFEVTGQIDLTILIDANGHVVDVASSVNHEHLHDFSARIAARFKRAYFIPGEINGLPVKSRLQITVVSEAISGTED